MSEPLPVEEALGPLRSALAERDVAVLVAPPGAGKTTVVPLRLIEEGWLAGRRILILEPRRLAARAAARRMAASLGEEVGATVGYQTRDERRIGPETRIEVLTEGILTRRLQSDPSLAGVGLVIFDEVHERNVSTDLGLALLLSAKAMFSSDVRILAMSATPDIVRFATLLGTQQTPAPVIVSEGRMFEVEIRHAPRRRDDRIEDATAATVSTALRETDGDVLVFLPGIGEIDRTRRLLESSVPGDVTIVRLAGALAADEQDVALRHRADGGRRVVLSTDIAETSLTVDGIRVVIDAGLARVPRLDARTGLTELVTVTSSRASAEQRSGRAGRVAPGVAYRMWSKMEHATRLSHLPAEITQVDLCNVMLDVAAWGATLDELALLDPPPKRAVDSARETLMMLRLLDERGAITALGRACLAVPVHPRLGAMVRRAADMDDPRRTWLACLLASLLDERDVFSGRPSEIPTDIAIRVEAVLGEAPPRGVQLHQGACDRVLRGARDIARRVGASRCEIDSDDVNANCGALLLAAYPDRLAMRRSTPGQFVLRTGGGAQMDDKDAIAGTGFVVAADLDSGRGNARIRRAASLTIDDVAAVLGDELVEERSLQWDKDRDDLVLRIVRRFDALRLDERRIPAPAGPETVAALVDRLRATQLAMLRWTDEARAMQLRIMFLRHHRGEDWPDVGDRSLIADIGRLIEPYLVECTGRSDVERLDLTMILLTTLSWEQSRDLEKFAPAMYAPPHGRPVPIDYSDPSSPRVRVRVQHLFGTTVQPSVLEGTIPLTLELLSPADRPIQVTADLPGFWRGSWAAVRKEMAGRYPKHDWPIDPASR